MNEFGSRQVWGRGGLVLVCSLLLGCSGSSATTGAVGAAGHGGATAATGGNGGTAATGLGGSNGGAPAAGGKGGAAAAGGQAGAGQLGSAGGAGAAGGATQSGSGGAGGSSTVGHGGGAGGATSNGGASASGGASGAGGAKGGGGTSGTCDPASLVWQYLLSCDTVTAGVLHTCVDYYATPAAAASSSISFRASCLGTVLSSPCPTANSAGSCLTVASEGVVETSPSAAYSRQYAYTDLGNVTASSWQAACHSVTQNQVYEPVGAAATAGVPTLVCPNTNTGGTGANGFAFSVSTVLNGETIECTNYYGMFTAAQLASLASLGIMTTPCPASHAVCTCPTPGANVGTGTVTHADAISYSTSFLPRTGCDAGSSASCTSGYTPP